MIKSDGTFKIVIDHGTLEISESHTVVATARARRIDARGYAKVVVENAYLDTEDEEESDQTCLEIFASEDAEVTVLSGLVFVQVSDRAKVWVLDASEGTSIECRDDSTAYLFDGEFEAFDNATVYVHAYAKGEGQDQSKIYSFDEVECGLHDEATAYAFGSSKMTQHGRHDRARVTVYENAEVMSCECCQS